MTSASSARHWIRLFLVTFLLTPSLSFAFARNNSCIDLFAPEVAEQYASTDIASTIKIMEELNTDRFQAFELHKGKTVYEYLQWVRSTQAYQLKEFMGHGFSEVNTRVVNHFRYLVQKKYNENQAQLELFKANRLTRHTRIENLKAPKTDELFHLQSEVISYITQINTIFAEFLSAVYFPRVITPEIAVLDLVKNWPLAEQHLSSLITDLELKNLKTKKVDLISYDENNRVVWIEVKYLGRSKEYAETSGHHIFEKMKNLTRLAAITPGFPKVILALAGPGRLNREAIHRYNSIGVEVLHLTPEWVNN